jgi:hypothetical protein
MGFLHGRSIAFACYLAISTIYSFQVILSFGILKEYLKFNHHRFMSLEAPPNSERKDTFKTFFGNLSEQDRANFAADYDRDPYLSLETAFRDIKDRRDADALMQGIRAYLANRSGLSPDKRHQDLLEISDFIEKRMGSEDDNYN